MSIHGNIQLVHSVNKGPFRELHRPWPTSKLDFTQIWVSNRVGRQTRSGWGANKIHKCVFHEKCADLLVDSHTFYAEWAPRVVLAHAFCAQCTCLLWWICTLWFLNQVYSFMHFDGFWCCRCTNFYWNWCLSSTVVCNVADDFSMITIRTNAPFLRSTWWLENQIHYHEGNTMKYVRNGDIIQLSVHYWRNIRLFQGTYFVTFAI